MQDLCLCTFDTNTIWKKCAEMRIGMLIYTNGFSCAMDSKKGDMVIRFVQQIPDIGEDGKAKKTNIEEVSSVVMNKETAQQLLTCLEDMLEDENNN